MLARNCFSKANSFSATNSRKESVWKRYRKGVLDRVTGIDQYFSRKIAIVSQTSFRLSRLIELIVVLSRQLSNRPTFATVRESNLSLSPSFSLSLSLSFRWKLDQLKMLLYLAE